jgi:hypothetical protein
MYIAVSNSLSVNITDLVQFVSENYLLISCLIHTIVLVRERPIIASRKWLTLPNVLAVQIICKRLLRQLGAISALCLRLSVSLLCADSLRLRLNV